MEEVKITWHGHACFSIECGKNILVDPFLTSNPVAKIKPEELHPDLILVTHGHFDHVEDAVIISKRTGSPVVSSFELSEMLGSEGASVIDINPGGTIDFSGIKVRATDAVHSSSYNGKYAGNPMGFIIDCGKKIYHAGDTDLFSGMELIGKYFRPDVAMLPIGGHYTMDQNDAIIAARMLKAKTLIPMHYNTFDAIRADPEKFKKDGSGIGMKVIVPEIEKSFSL